MQNKFLLVFLISMSIFTSANATVNLASIPGVVVENNTIRVTGRKLTSKNNPLLLLHRVKLSHSYFHDALY